MEEAERIKSDEMKRYFVNGSPIGLTISVNAWPLDFRYKDDQWEALDWDSCKRTLDDETIRDLIAGRGPSMDSGK